jgi:hypothetical protein
MLYIIAGNRKQADDYAKKNGIYPLGYEYVNDPSVLREKGRINYVKTGTWYTRSNIGYILSILEQEEATEVDDDSPTIQVSKELFALCYSLAKRIKTSHGGWWESYASIDEQILIKIVDSTAEKFGIKKT